MNTIITGATGGLGLGFVSQALRDKHRVVAVARNPEQSKELQSLKGDYREQLILCQADLLDQSAPKKIIAAASEMPAVDLLINNAGIYKKGETIHDFMESFQINSVVPFLIAKELFPKLRASKNPKLIQITSLMGSIGDNESGGSYAYRASKAALNMITKTMAQDEEWLSCAVLHPGWVKTKMGGADAPTTIQESVSGMWKVISGISSKNSGQFFDFEGDTLPW